MERGAARHLVFLCAAVVVADARPRPSAGPAVSEAKAAALFDTLARHFPDAPAPRRQALVAKVLAGVPTFEGGLAFLRRIEAEAAQLGAGLDAGARRTVLADLARIAEADGTVSFPELTVLRAVVAHIGVPPPHEVDADAGSVLWADA